MSFDEFEERLHKHNPQLHILNKPERESDIAEVHCNDCGATYQTKRLNLRKNIERGQKGCPVCAGRLVVKGINDVATTDPELVPYFLNKEDAYKYTRTSKQKAWFVCPDCGCKKHIDIGHFVRSKNKCNTCSDGISYPNKFARALLSQLPLDEWCCEWHTSWLGGKSFDNYFKYEGKPYVLEMDGEQHKDTRNPWNSEKTVNNDSLKDKLAEEHGITVIRIDCYESDRDFISNNIKNSLLGKLFDLSKIDWQKCDSIACKSLVIKVCEYYNKVTIDTDEIARHFDLNRGTVACYLKKGYELGLCDFTYELTRKRVGEKNKRLFRKRYGIPVIAFDDKGGFLGKYPSYEDCAEELNRMFPDKCFKGKSINAKLSHYNGECNYRGFYFKKAQGD